MPIRCIHFDSCNTDTKESFFADRCLNKRIKNELGPNEGYGLIFEERRSLEWMNDHCQKIRNNELKYDEDVNRYITLTLSDLVNPKFLDSMK